LEFDQSLLFHRYHSLNNYFPFLSPSLFSLRLEGRRVACISFQEVGVVEPTPTTGKRTNLCCITLLSFELFLEKGI
jgi:hypothetical protein